MIRVAQVVTRFIAGAGGVALRGAQGLDPARFRVTILAGEGGRLFDEAESSGFEVVRLRHMRPEISPRHDLAGLVELTDELRRRDFHVVQTHSAKGGALGRIAARRAGVPGVVHTLHGFPFHDFQAAPVRRTYIGIERWLGGFTDRFLAVGADVASEAVRLRIAPPDRVRVIAPAIDTASIVPADPATRAAARRTLGLPLDAEVVGTVGRLADQKAPDHMLKAFARLDRPDARFVWIGGGPLYESMQRRIARAHLQDRFLLLGERRDVGRLLAAFDVFAMASLYEGMPCSIAEAMSAGVAVAATGVNSVPELVIPGRTGILVPPGRPELLSRAIGHLLDRPDERARLAAAARHHVHGRFDPSELGRDLEATFDELIDEAGATVALPLKKVTLA